MNTLIIFGAKYLFVLSPLLVAWFFYKASRESRKKVIIFTLITLPLAFIIAVTARHFYFNPRPFVVLGFEPLISHTPDNGFPSDHVLLLGTLASIMLFFNRKWSIPLWIITLLVGISRVYAGVHHVVDIGGSILIALLSATYAYAIIHKPWKTNNQTSF